MTPLETVNSHYQVIIDKDINGICSKYVQSEETYVVLEGPRLTTIGYTKIASGWEAFCNSALTLNNISWVEGPFAEESSEMAWVSGIINLEVAIHKTTETKNFTNTFRATFVLLKQQGKWLIKHEHVSVAHPDPYGIGDWIQQKTTT